MQTMKLTNLNTAFIPAGTIVHVGGLPYYLADITRVFGVNIKVLDSDVNAGLPVLLTGQEDTETGRV